MKDYYSFARTSIGFSHISSKKPCQDYSLQFQNDVASVLIIKHKAGILNRTQAENRGK